MARYSSDPPTPGVPIHSLGQGECTRTLATDISGLERDTFQERQELEIHERNEDMMHEGGNEFLVNEQQAVVTHPELPSSSTVFRSLPSFPPQLPSALLVQDSGRHREMAERTSAGHFHPLPLPPHFSASPQHLFPTQSKDYSETYKIVGA